MRRIVKNLLIVCGVLVLCVLIIRYIGIGDYFTLSNLQAQHAQLMIYVNNHYLASVLIFIIVYTTILATPIPGTAPLTLAGGYLFGTVLGFVYSLFAAVAGATISFIISQYVVKHWITDKYDVQVIRFKQKFAAYGAGYLLMLHFLTIVPFSVIVLLATLAEVRVWTFIWTAAVGSAPLFFIYAYTAQRFATMKSVNEIFSPTVLLLLALLVLLACIPMIIKRFKKDW